MLLLEPATKLDQRDANAAREATLDTGVAGKVKETKKQPSPVGRGRELLDKHGRSMRGLSVLRMKRRRRRINRRSLSCYNRTHIAETKSGS